MGTRQPIGEVAVPNFLLEQERLPLKYVTPIRTLFNTIMEFIFRSCSDIFKFITAGVIRVVDIYIFSCTLTHLYMLNTLIFSCIQVYLNHGKTF